MNLPASLCHTESVTPALDGRRASGRSFAAVASQRHSLSAYTYSIYYGRDTVSSHAAARGRRRLRRAQLWPPTVRMDRSFSPSVSEPSLTFTGHARPGCTHAGPFSGVVRCQPSARRPTGRRRRPEASAPSSARPRGVFSEMAPGNRALGDGGAGQVHGQALVRLEPLASGRDATGPRGAHGKSPAQP